MSLIRWNPTQEIASMRSLMDRFFEDFTPNISPDFGRQVVAPALDIMEHEDSVEVRADLPGVSPDEVNIEFKDGTVVISANVNKEQVEEKGTYTRRERYSGTYRRSLSIPETLDVQNAEASFEHGVLSLRLPRKPESQPLRIPVQTSTTINAE